MKPRPRHKYTAAAYLSYYAAVNATFVVSFDDDLRHCFFQFFISDEDRYLINWQLTVKRGDDIPSRHAPYEKLLCDSREIVMRFMANETLSPEAWSATHATSNVTACVLELSDHRCRS